MRSLVLVLGLVLTAGPAWGFDYDRYAPGDLDQVMAEKPNCAEHGHEGPHDGEMVVTTPQPWRLDVTLVRQAFPCPAAELVKHALIAIGAPGATEVPITNCVQVESPSGLSVGMAIQDSLAPYLAEEVQVGQRFQIYAIRVFLSEAGPGLLINEFQALPSGGSEENPS